MTAVEYIKEKLLGNEYWYEDMTFDQIIDQAKEMEKEQLKDAYFNGRYEADKIVMGHNFYSEQYYNQTFKSE